LQCAHCGIARPILFEAMNAVFLDSIIQERLVKGRLALKVEDAPFSLPARAWGVRGIVRSHR
jgi:hypothetical protein